MMKTMMMMMTIMMTMLKTAIMMNTPSCYSTQRIKIKEVGKCPQSIKLQEYSVYYRLQISNLLHFFKKSPEDEANLSVPFHTPLSGTLSHCSSLNVSEQVLHPCKKK